MHLEAPMLKMIVQQQCTTVGVCGGVLHHFGIMTWAISGKCSS